MNAPTQTPQIQRGQAGLLLIPLLAGSAVAVSLGLYGRFHEPSGVAVSLAGFSSMLTVKVWLTSGATFFALIQMVSALAMYGKLGMTCEPWIGPLHRWSGRIAFLLAVPVAVHCLYAVGFAAADTRTLAHSLFGCFFFGVFTVKMLALPKPGLKGWTLPVLGGAAFTALIALWFTSSYWYFTTFGVSL